MPSLLLRVDAGERIGTGHLMRCLALAQAWIGEAGDAVIAAASPDERALERTASAGARLQTITSEPGTDADARETIAAARTAGAAWVVVDGYHFPTSYQRALSGAGLRVLCIDDNGEAGEYAADLILNQNLHATSELYARRPPKTELLLGAPYVLLRPEFIRMDPRERIVPSSARRILVTLGGGASGTALTTVLEILAGSGVERFDVIAITGSSADLPSLERAAASVRGRVWFMEQSRDMPELMAWADLAIAGGGSTSWELAFMGLPALSIVMAQNQRAAVEALEKSAAAVSLGSHDALRGDSGALLRTLLDDQPARERMSAAGRALIDGRGASRVLAAMTGRPVHKDGRVADAARGGRQE